METTDQICVYHDRALRSKLEFVVNQLSGKVIKLKIYFYMANSLVCLKCWPTPGMEFRVCLFLTFFVTGVGRSRGRWRHDVMVRYSMYTVRLIGDTTHPNQRIERDMHLQTKLRKPF